MSGAIAAFDDAHCIASAIRSARKQPLGDVEYLASIDAQVGSEVIQSDPGRRSSLCIVPRLWRARSS